MQDNSIHVEKEKTFLLLIVGSKACHGQCLPKVDGSGSKLLHESDRYEGISEKLIVSTVAIKLDKLAQHLGLIIYNKKGHLKSALKPISYKAIEAVTYHLS